MSISVSRALDLSEKALSAGSYTSRIVNPEAPFSSLQLSSTVNTDFLLPNQVMNFARSTLHFSYLLNDTLAAHDGKFNEAHSGFLAPIDGITLKTASGVTLVEMNNLPEYTKIVWRPETDLQEFLTFPCHSVAKATVAAVTEPGQLFNRIRAVNTFGSDAAYQAGSTHTSVENGTTRVSADDSYTAVANHISSIVAMAHNAAGAVGVRVILPLRMIYGCLLAVDRDLYFNEQLRLTVRWNQGAKWGFVSAASPPTALSIDLAESPTVTNVFLRMAIETNETVAAMVRDRCMGGTGVNITVPYTYSFKAMSDGVALSTNAIIRKLNRGHGSKCMRVICAIMSTQQQGNMYCNAYNVGSTKWNAFRTYLDSKPIPDDILQISNDTAYLYHSEKLKGSCIKSVQDWLAVPAIIEDFSGVVRTKDYVEHDCHQSGIDLSREREFQLQFVNVPATAQPVFIFAQCQKMLSINSQGITML